jgi:hypothetical protein
MGKKSKAIKEVFSFHRPKISISGRDLLHLAQLCLTEWKKILMRKRRLLPSEQLFFAAYISFSVGSVFSFAIAEIFGRSLLATLPLIVGFSLSLLFNKAASKIINCRGPSS